MSMTNRRKPSFRTSATRAAIAALAAFTLVPLSFLGPGVSAVDPTFAWRIEVIDQGVNLVGATSLALDSRGWPHIAYADDGAGVVRYVRWNGQAWDILSAPQSGWAYGIVSLALDIRDRPHISFFDVQGGRIKYLHLAEFGWRVVAVDNGFYEGYHSIALDSAGVPHIAYPWQNGFLRHARLLGSSWVTETVDPDVVVARDTSIALDGAGNPHIAYYGKGNLYHARWVGSRWDVEAVENGSHPESVTLRIGTDEVARIGYRNPMTNELRYATQTTSGWVFETVDREGEPGWHGRLALDAGNNPHLSYYTRETALFKYAHKDGNAWTINVVDVTDVAGWWSDIAMGRDGRPHFSYYSYRDRSVRYATGGYGVGIRAWPVRNLTPTSAHVQVELTSLGPATEVQVAIEWRVGDGPWQRVQETTLATPSIVSTLLEGLTPQTTYEFRGLALLDGVPMYSDTQDFTTPATSPSGVSLPVEIIVPLATLVAIAAAISVYVVRQRRRKVS